MNIGSGPVTNPLSATFAGLRAKGETPGEIRGFARAMRELAVHPDIPEGAPTVDTVGTGGDGSGSLNLSTGTGLLAAAAGARVVKHGGALPHGSAVGSDEVDEVVIEQRDRGAFDLLSERAEQ